MLSLASAVWVAVIRIVVPLLTLPITLGHSTYCKLAWLFHRSQLIKTCIQNSTIYAVVRRHLHVSLATPTNELHPLVERVTAYLLYKQTSCKRATPSGSHPVMTRSLFSNKTLSCFELSTWSDLGPQIYTISLQGLNGATALVAPVCIACRSTLQTAGPRWELTLLLALNSAPCPHLIHSFPFG